jgi:hypothetical protein
LIEQNFAKPTNVEAQRIIKIIDELLINMEVQCYLDSEFLASFLNQDLTKELLGNKVNELSSSLIRMLAYQAKLESKFTELTSVEECNPL